MNEEIPRFPSTGDVVYITEANKVAIAELMGHTVEHLDWMLASPKRYSDLHIRYQGDGRYQGWYMNWEWIEGVSEDEKEAIRERDNSTHPGWLKLMAERKSSEW